MAVTDGYRLSLRSVHLDKPFADDSMTVIVPARSLANWAHHCRRRYRTACTSACHTSANQIIFQIWGKGGTRAGFHRAELASQLIDARFPDYRAIIPKSHTTRTVVDTAAFLKAVAR